MYMLRMLWRLTFSTYNFIQNTVSVESTDIISDRYRNGYVSGKCESSAIFAGNCRHRYTSMNEPHFLYYRLGVSVERMVK